MAKRFRKKNQYPTVRDGQSGFERAVPEVWIHKMAYKKHFVTKYHFHYIIINLPLVVVLSEFSDMRNENLE